MRYYIRALLADVLDVVQVNLKRILVEAISLLYVFYVGF